MRLALCLLVWTCLFLRVPVASAQASATSADSSAKETTPTQSHSAFPIDVSLGNLTGGGMGLLLKGTQFHSPDTWARPNRYAFVALDVDAAWSTVATVLDHATVTLKPGVVLNLNAPLFREAEPGLALFADARLMHGQYEQGDSTALANQNFVGAGLDLQLPFLNDALSWWEATVGDPGTPLGLIPRFSVTHYWRVNAFAGPNELPDQLTANQLQVRLNGDIVLPLHLRGVFDLKWTRPTQGAVRSWQSAIDVGAYAMLPMLKDLAPVVRFVSGEEGGFTYDRTVLFGLLYKRLK